MAIKYSSLYKALVNANTTAYSYAGPHAERSGQMVLRYAEFTGTIPATDSLYIAGGFLKGEKIIAFDAIRSGDSDTDNDFTFNLGWRLGTGSEFAAASTGMQAAAAVTLAPAALLAIAGASEGDDLVLARVAGELEASVTHRFLIQSMVP